MKTQTPTPAQLQYRFDITGAVQFFMTQIHFLSSQRPAAAELIHRIKHDWKAQPSSNPNVDRTELAERIELTAKRLLEVGNADSKMTSYAGRALEALHTVNLAVQKSDEQYAREQAPQDHNQILLNKIRELLA